MIFSSAPFLVFFAVVLAAYALAANYGQRAAVILAASIIFYASWKPAYLILLFASLTVNYLFYLGLNKKRSFWLLATAITLNLLVLGVFKYLGLLFETALLAFNWVGVERVQARPDWLDWALPLGISFYTFHMLSVMIDVYRGDWTRRISFLSWTMYVTFFPHMIAGPILRASELVEQLEYLEPLRLRNLQLGALIFCGGFLKKTLLADNLAPIVDDLYGHPDALSTSSAWLATLAFGLQIYYDFSGYSEMAIGLARVFGVTLPRNFLYPYISRNPREFWQRWHITLSRWLRDYLYVSLGGSRCSTMRNMANLMITMLLGGLWHGAGWTFVFWGFLHGSYLIGHRFLLYLSKITGIAQKPRTAYTMSSLGWFITMVLVCFTWVFFRAENFGSAWRISSLMVGVAAESTEPLPVRLYERLIVTVAGLIVFFEPVFVRWLNNRDPVATWWSVPFPIRGIVYAGMVLFVTIFGGQTQKFIYFDF
jgi:alginate O-acetyltransferase complex protein AlgI